MERERGKERELENDDVIILDRYFLTETERQLTIFFHSKREKKKLIWTKKFLTKNVLAINVLLGCLRSGNPN
jgi:hypothetical protein